MTERREASIRDVGGGQTLGPAWRNTIAFAAGHLSLPPPPLHPTDSFSPGLERARASTLFTSPLPLPQPRSKQPAKPAKTDRVAGSRVALR